MDGIVGKTYKTYNSLPPCQEIDISCHKLSQNDNFVSKISEFGCRHLETPFSGPRDPDFPADPNFGSGPVIQLGLDLVRSLFACFGGSEVWPGRLLQVCVEPRLEPVHRTLPLRVMRSLLSRWALQFDVINFHAGLPRESRDLNLESSEHLSDILTII